MTEHDWLNSTEAAEMIAYTNPTDEQLRRWVEACRNKFGIGEGWSNINNTDEIRGAAKAWSYLDGVSTPREKVANLLRAIVGNPFRPVGVIRVWESKPAKDVPGRENFFFGELQTAPVPWLTDEVKALARTLYEGVECERCCGKGKKNARRDGMTGVVEEIMMHGLIAPTATAPNFNPPRKGRKGYWRTCWKRRDAPTRTSCIGCGGRSGVRNVVGMD